MGLATRAFVSDLGQLATMREFVRDACRRAWGPGASDERIAQLELAVDEAAANVILHAYRGEAGRPIEVAVDADTDQVCVRLYHEGRGFDPSAVAPPAFDGSRETGFGLYLIGRSVDEVAFFQDEHGRQGIRLVKKRR